MIFDSLQIRDVLLRNRIIVSPMCQYSSTDVFATDWHLVHLGSRAVGGAALVFTEATAVVPEGRISPQDLGIWKDEHIEMLARITKFIHSQGAAVGIQLAHAGRKGSTARPWEGGKPLPPGEDPWPTIAPSALPFGPGWHTPRAMNEEDMARVRAAFADSAKRAVRLGFDAIELHFAHGYLLHSFVSPLANKRNDEFGGSFEGRMRFPLDVVRDTRAVVPRGIPLGARITGTDWVDGGLTPDDAVKMAKALKAKGYEYQYLFCRNAGHSVGNAQAQFLPHAIEWVWRGYAPKKSN